MRTRGYKRIAQIDYPLLARWTGLRRGTLYNRRAELRGLGVLELISWANAVRAGRGLPPLTPENADADQPNEPNPIARSSKPTGTS